MKTNYLLAILSVLMIFAWLMVSAYRPETKKEDPKYFIEVPSNIRLQSVETKTGVECIIYESTYGGGVSCNWDKYNRLNTKDDG